MGARRHAVDEARRATGDVDPDAMWRRGAAGTAVAPTPPSARRERSRRPASDEPSPWSREWVEAPLPTIAEVRERWRRELDLDRAPTPTRRPVATTARTSRPSGRHRAISVPRQPPSATTGLVVLVGLIVMSIVAVSVSIGWALVPPTAEPPTEVLPPNDSVRWRVVVDRRLTPEAFVADTSNVAYVDDGELVVVDAATGTGVWARGLPDASRYQVQLYDRTVVAVAESPGAATIAGFDVASGAVRWRRTRDDTVFTPRPDGLIEYLDTGATTAVRVLDPRTGRAMGPPSVASGLMPPAGYEIGRSGNTLVLFDAATGRILEPAVPDLGFSSIAPIGDHVVGFTAEAGIVLFDRQGVATDQRPFVSAAHGDFRGRAELVGGVPGTELGIVASGTSIGFDVGDDLIEVEWELLGRVGSPVDTEVGPVSIARTVHPVTAEIDVELIDVRSGTSIAVTDLGTTREADPVVVHDGYVAAPALGDPERKVTAVGFDGEERWTLPTPPGSWFEVASGTLYVVDPSEGTLTAHG